MEIRPIAYYHGPLRSRFGVPRQSGLSDSLEGRIVFEPEYRREEALRGLLGEGGFDRIWLITIATTPRARQKKDRKSVV